ncbi:MAG: hypothetical protein ACFFBD_01225, partial [Candidatus Hodarchaeota archaeon]
RELFRKLIIQHKHWKKILTTVGTSDTSTILSKSNFKRIAVNERLEISSNDFVKTYSLKPIKDIVITPFQNKDLIEVQYVENKCFPSIYHWPPETILSMAQLDDFSLLSSIHLLIGIISGIMFQIVILRSNYNLLPS